MKIKTIKDIAYTINYCKEHNKPMPIIICGAGISKTAGIPLTGKIIDDVYNKFSGKSEINELKSQGCKDYYKIMRALRAEERQDLFKEYIKSSDVRLNLASIYIAQLLDEKLIDYVYTVNFDDILLKASALFNFIPPVYDLANVTDLNSNEFVKNSLVYLHGQYYGQWLLNTPDEIDKGLKNVHNLFQRVCNRPWIVVGYSGEDEIFDKLNEIQSFTSDLYWVSYDDNHLNQKVRAGLLDSPNKNAYLISNIDADTFFLELCTELDLGYPPLFDKPFTFLETYFDKIQDFTSPAPNYDGIYQGLSKQKDISLNWIKKAKAEIENNNLIENLQQQIIDALIKGEFSEEEVKPFENSIKLNNYEEANVVLSLYYNNWGNAIYNLAKIKNDESLFLDSFAKYQKASELNPTYYSIYNNWGNTILHLAKIKNDESLFLDSFAKYQKASMLNPTYYSIYNNWGTAISDLAKIKNDESLFLDSFAKYQKASELNPTDYSIYYNWGTAISDLAKIKSDESLFLDSFAKYQKASELNPTDYSIYYNWGTAISDLAKIKNDESLFLDSFTKYHKASELNPADYSIYYNWGTAILHLAKIKNDEILFDQAEIILKKGVDMGGETYNLACLYAVKNKKKEALEYLKLTLDKTEIIIEYIHEDNDWDNLREDIDFKNLILNY